MTKTPKPDWREVGHTISGYELWGSFEACAAVSNKVRDHLGAGGGPELLTENELLTFLFFSARAERHGGRDWPDTTEQDRALAEIESRRAPKPKK